MVGGEPCAVKARASGGTLCWFEWKERLYGRGAYVVLLNRKGRPRESQTKDVVVLFSFEGHDTALRLRASCGGRMSQCLDISYLTLPLFVATVHPLSSFSA
jgi:hypothetical protein